MITLGNIDGLNQPAMGNLHLLIDITPIEKDLRPYVDMVIPFTSPLEKDGTIESDYGIKRLKSAIDRRCSMRTLSKMAEYFKKDIKQTGSDHEEHIYLR